MRDLQREVAEFRQWLGENALPDFREKSQDTYDHNHNIVFDTLTSFAQEMKDAAIHQDFDEFDSAKEHYIKTFTYANTQIAKQYYEDMLDHFLDEGLDNLNAKSMAIDHVWNKHPLYHEWLPAYVTMSAGDRSFDLVGSSKFASNERPHVTTKDVAHLSKNPQEDPWKYLRGNDGKVMDNNIIHR